MPNLVSTAALLLHGDKTMQITIERQSFGNRWEAVATAKVWTIADAIGNMLSANGDTIRAVCGIVVVDYVSGERVKVAA